nr:MAG TPA: hypothetical protein [Caudoviricetes sp.]
MLYPRLNLLYLFVWKIKKPHDVRPFCKTTTTLRVN